MSRKDISWVECSKVNLIVGWKLFMKFFMDWSSSVVSRKIRKISSMNLFQKGMAQMKASQMVSSWRHMMQALRYNLLIADDALLQKELNSLTVPLLARQYPLEIITSNISKVLLHSRDTLLYKPPMVASPKRVLPIVTLYSPEGRHFSQSVQNRWHIIENDPQLQNI